MIAKGLFILGGSICILLGLFLTLLVVGMLEQPGGMGVEKLLGPLIGLAALGLFVTGGFCLYAARLVGKRRASEQSSIPRRQ
jgi:hypothetical protein